MDAFSALELPLSLEQEFIASFTRKMGDSHVHIDLLLEGAVNIGALKESLFNVYRRHSILRSRIQLNDSSYKQTIFPEDSLTLHCYRINNSVGEEEAIIKFIGELIWQPFLIPAGELFRVHIIELADGNYALSILAHHILMDGWSTGILCAEICEQYNSLINNRPANHPPLKIQFSDYIAWQTEWLEGERGRRQIEYWQRKFELLPEPIDLPLDYPRPTLRNSGGAMEMIHISVEVCDALQKRSAQEGVTLFMLLLTAYQVALSQWSQQTDIAIYVVTAGRTQPHLDDLVGCFAHPILLRTALRSGISFNEALQCVKRTCLDAYTRQNALAFGPKGLAKQHEIPVSLTGFNFHIYSQPEWALDNIRVTELQIPTPDRESIQFEDIFLDLTLLPTGIRGYLLYTTDIFKAETMKKFLADFEKIIGLAIEDPNSAVI